MSDPIIVTSSRAAPQGAGPSVVVPNASADAGADVVRPASGAPAVTMVDGLEDAVRALQQQAFDVGAELEVSIDDELDRVIVTLRDRRDGTVLRQIPSEEVLRIARLLRSDAAPLVQVVV